MLYYLSNTLLKEQIPYLFNFKFIQYKLFYCFEGYIWRAGERKL